MAEILLPEILQVPNKLLPLITKLNDYRYFLVEGGRGGGKSQAIARLILYLTDKQNLRVVCGREIQNSIAESVYSLFVDLIRKYSLNFDVFSNKIVNKTTGSTINFRGFREQGAFNIQGMEGIDITWIDESQALTKQTLDVLIPTIRKDKAKIFFTMNRHVHNDPAYALFYNREDCLHIHINYDDNPFCTNALIKEANECQSRSQQDFDHIWRGIPLSQSEDAVFGFEELKETQKNKHELRPSYGMRLAGFDIARYGDDKCAVCILQQMGSLYWETYYVDEWDKKDLNYTTGKILTIHNEHNIEKSIIDEDGIGAGPLDTLTKGRGLEQFIGFRNPSISYNNNKYYGNARTENAFRVKDMVLKGHLAITDDALIEELCTLRYTFDNNQRKVLISKDVMRSKFKVKSPNRADALIMAVSLIGEIKTDQDSQYYNQQRYYKEDNVLCMR